MQGFEDWEYEVGFCRVYLEGLSRWAARHASPELNIHLLDERLSGNPVSSYWLSEEIVRLRKARSMLSFERSDGLGNLRGQNAATAIIRQYFDEPYDLKMHQKHVANLVGENGLPFSYLSDWSHAIKRLGEGHIVQFEKLLAEFFWVFTFQDYSIEQVNMQTAADVRAQIQARERAQELQRIRAEAQRQRRQAEEAARRAEREAKELKEKQLAEQRRLAEESKRQRAQNYTAVMLEQFARVFGGSVSFGHYCSMNEKYFIDEDKYGSYVSLTSEKFVDNQEQFATSLQASMKELRSKLKRLDRQQSFDLAFRCFAFGAPHIVIADKDLHKAREVLLTRGQFANLDWLPVSRLFSPRGEDSDTNMTGSIRKKYLDQFIDDGDIVGLANFITALWQGTPRHILEDYFAGPGSRWEGPGKSVR